MAIKRPTWIEQMLHDAALRNSFFETCDLLMAQLGADVEEVVLSGDTQRAAALVGQKRGIQMVRRQITMYLQEDRANAEFTKEMEGEKSGRSKD